MEIIILIAIVGIAYFYISNNSRKVKDETVVTTTHTVKTATGSQTITRTTTINDVQTDIRSPSTPINFPEHKIIPPEQPSSQEIPPYVRSKLEKITHPAQIAYKEPEFKECSGCKRVQPISEFRANLNQPDGLTKWCNQCMTNGAPSPSDMKGTKFCPKCGQNRRKTSFYATSKYPDGLSKWCKFCLPQRKKKS